MLFFAIPNGTIRMKRLGLGLYGEVIYIGPSTYGGRRIFLATNINIFLSIWRKWA